MELELTADTLAICRFDADATLPAWATNPTGFVSVTRTDAELSIVVPDDLPPAEVTAERGWRALAVRGPLDFSLTGVLASLAVPLADAGIPVFVISTYDTDWLLVRDYHLDEAVAALGSSGHTVARPDR